MKKSVLATVADARVGLAQLAENQFERVRAAIGGARVVLIGEETHGSQEFYALRAAITRALVERENFSLVLCESDFPSFYRLHQFVGGGAQAATQTIATPPVDVYSASSASQLPSMDIPTATVSSQAALSKLTTEEVMEVLKARFPVWMWRNEVVRDFVTWLKAENLRREIATTAPFFSTLPVALFGLDIYSMFTSTDQVIAYLDAVDPQMAERARKRYGVLQEFRPSEAAYCRAVLSGTVPAQTNKIRVMLEDLDGKAAEYKRLFGDGDEYFSAHENARIVLAAEEYYRESYFGSSLTWNIRDHAMMDMIMNALEYYDEKLWMMHKDNIESGSDATEAGQQPRPPPRARAVVWAHNSHIGDAAATEQYKRWGQVNVGHLVRQVLGKDDCYLIGFSTNTGTVRAARQWNGRDFVMNLNPALAGSTGELLHQASEVAPAMRDFGLFFRKNAPLDAPAERQAALTPVEEAAREELAKPRPERFIGVQYVKQTERRSHYSQCVLSDQFDLLIHLDETSALRPLPELAEPKLPPSRPGTVDYSKWDKLAAEAADDSEDEVVN
ncbi:hypothetical protein PybrP1_008304 [[Pythium] brassicae (nom. inval.)]|nr:hypothetical protein PybrP1_008304 [[Pythium] brassicae (nom. inval.)]